MKPLRLRTKFTLISALFVLAVVVLISSVFVITLTRGAINRAEVDANVAARQVLHQAQQAMDDAKLAGLALPASESSEDVRDYLQHVLEGSHGLSNELDSVLAHYPAIYEVSIADGGGMALISSDPALVNKALRPRNPFNLLTSMSFYKQLRVIFGPTQLYQVQVPFELRSSAGQAPYGEVRVTMEVGLLRAEITPELKSAGLLALGAVLISTLLSAAFIRGMLAPLDAINQQLDSYSGGKFDAALARSTATASGDEFTQVRTKITRLGEQLRGVREIFSTLRENLHQVMAGLDDGLILFTHEGRAVLVSPAVEKFLNAPADQILGRHATEIFPPDHPLRRAFLFEGDRLLPVKEVEINLPGASEIEGSRRISVTVHAVPDSAPSPNEPAAAETFGALVTLRDMESRERIGTELETSERLSALTRITAGVAHEVKNPLNSMRLWLENLKENLPPGNEVSTQAVRVLDSEIDRLDRVVKRFLDFTKPVEMRVEEVSLAPLLTRIVEVAQPQIDRSKLKVDLRLANGVPPVRGDAELLRQAVLNLVLNAVQAMPDGGRLTISLERRGDDAQVLVADTGKGIPPEHRNRIFQLFFTTRKGGSGLGLATTFRIVQLHNGSIDFVSEPGQGTVFRIELPIAHSQSAGMEAASSGRSASGADSVHTEKTVQVTPQP
jgi:signal transduction histidine kinase/type II secretory pathway pseudopilin PulG